MNPDPNPLPTAEALPTDFDAAIEEIIKLRQLLNDMKGIQTQSDDLITGYKNEIADLKNQLADKDFLVNEYLQAAKKG